MENVELAVSVDKKFYFNIIFLIVILIVKLHNSLDFSELLEVWKLSQSSRWCLKKFKFEEFPRKSLENVKNESLYRKKMSIFS